MTRAWVTEKYQVVTRDQQVAGLNPTAANFPSWGYACGFGDRL